MTDETRTYRNAVTGLLEQCHPRVARAAKTLIEVSQDAKPLAYLPIPQAAIEDLLRPEREQGVEPAGDADLPDDISATEE